MSNWYVGQKVVCIKDHSEACTRKGVMYVINSLVTCTCGLVHLDVGVRLPPEYDHTDCHCRLPILGPIWFQGSERFRPLDTLTATMDRLESEGAPVEVEISEPVLNRSN